MNKDTLRQHLSISPQEKILLIEKMEIAAEGAYKSWSYIFLHIPKFTPSGWIIMTDKRVLLVDTQYTTTANILIQNIQKVNINHTLVNNIRRQQRQAFFTNFWKRTITGIPFFLLFVFFSDYIFAFLQSPFFFLFLILLGGLGVSQSRKDPFFLSALIFIDENGIETYSGIISSRIARKIRSAIHNHVSTKNISVPVGHSSWIKNILLFLLIAFVVIVASFIITFYTS